MSVDLMIPKLGHYARLLREKKWNMRQAKNIFTPFLVLICIADRKESYRIDYQVANLCFKYCVCEIVYLN